MVSFIAKIALVPASLAPVAPRAPIGKATSYKVRYWSHADKQWIDDDKEHTNRKLALEARNAFGPNEKATVIAQLSNGKRVFIKGTKR